MLTIRPFHQFNDRQVYLLQTHRHSLSDGQLDVDIHPDNTDDQALEKLTEHHQLPHQPYFFKQVHGAQCVQLAIPPTAHFSQATDACFTTQLNIICGIMTADCLPVLITDTQASFVAAVHCGWRSLYQGILTKALAKIKTEHALKLWFGPTICQHHYQVDKDFKDHYLAAHPSAHSAFTSPENEYCFADLKKLALNQLQNHSIQVVDDSHICTYENPDYYSWRQNRTKARQGSFIWMS